MLESLEWHQENNNQTQIGRNLKQESEMRLCHAMKDLNFPLLKMKWTKSVKMYAAYKIGK